MVFCRELRSYQFMMDIIGLRESHVEIFLAHDMAFSIRLDMCGMWTVKDLVVATRRDVPEHRSLYAFRRDNEGKNHVLAKYGRNVDLSVASATTGSDKSAILVQCACFLGAIARYDRIFTDRLHISIAGAILGVETYLFDNNYGKNFHVYKFSMEHRFDLVRYFESVEEFPMKEELFERQN